MSSALQSPRVIAPAPRRQLDGRLRHTYRRAAEEALIYLETRGIRALQGLEEVAAELRAETDGEALPLMGDHILSRRAAIEEFNRELELARSTRDHLEFALRRRMDEILVAVDEAAARWNAFLGGDAAQAAMGGRKAAALAALESAEAQALRKLEEICRTDPAWNHRERIRREETLALCGHLHRILGAFAYAPEDLARVARIMRSAVVMIGDRKFLEEVRGRVYIREGDIAAVRRHALILEVPGVVCRRRGIWGRVWAWIGDPRPLPWIAEDAVAVIRHAAARLDMGALARGELAFSPEFIDSVTGLTEPLSVRQARDELRRAREAVLAARAETPENALRIAN